MEAFLNIIINLYILIILVDIFLIIIYTYVYGKEIGGKLECDKEFLNSKSKIAFFAIMPLVNIVFGFFLISEILITNEKETK